MLDNILLHSRPINNPDYAFKEDGSGWTALVNLDTTTSVALDETGLLVWKTIDGRRTVMQIIASIKDQFSDVPDSVVDDVLMILKTLLDAGLIGFEVRL